MSSSLLRRISLAGCLAIWCSASQLIADDKLNALIKEGNYKEAIAHAEKSLPAASRDVDAWVQLAKAYQVTGAKDKALAACQSAQKANPSDARVYLAFGSYYLDEKKYQEALDNYQRCYVLDRSAVAAEGIAVSASRLGQWDKARDAAESAVQIDSTVIESRLILAEIFLKSKEYKNAAPQVEFITRQKPGEVKYWKQLAACYDKTGDAKALSAADRKIIELDKKDVPSRRRLAEYSLAEKDTATAFDLCKELAVLTPGDAKVFRLLYQISAERNNKKDAILYLKNYLVLDSTVAVSYKALGDLLFEQKDTDGALDAYRHALRLDPQIKGFFKKYESIVLQKKLDDEAVRVIKAAIAAGEADAASYTALADILKKQRDCAGAIKMYQEALKGDANNVATLTSLGECQAQTNATSAAIITYEQVVLMNPKAVGEIKILGDLQMKAGKPDNAIATYRKYISKAADDAAIAKVIGLYEYGKKQYKDVIAHLELVRDAKLQDAEYWIAIGESQFRTGDYKNAAASLSKAQALKPTGQALATTLKLLGEAYEKSGDNAKAAEAYGAYTAIPGVRDADAAYLKGFLREKTDRAGAVAVYQANTTVYPKDYRNFLRMGIIYSEDKTALAKANAALTSASQLNDSLPVVWEKLGEINGALKNEEKELASYKKLLALQPQHLQANKRVGMILVKKGQIPQGITNLETALALSPKDLDVILILSDAYIKTKRPQQAADLLVKAKEQRGEDVAIRLQLIETREAAGQKDAAAKERDDLAELDKKIVSRDKKDIDSRRRLAAYYAANKEEAKAAELYRELAILTPKDASIYRNLYEIANAKGAKKDAVLYLKNYLVLDSSQALYVRALGNLLYEQKDLDGALEAYRKALRIDPKVTGFYKNYESIVLQKNLESEAIRAITGGIAAKEADAASYIALGDIHAKRKEYGSAIKMYQDALKTDAKNIAVLASLAECQARNGDAAAAEITYEQVVLMNPGARLEYKNLGDLQMALKKNDKAIGSYKKYLSKEPNDNKTACQVGLYEFNRKQYAEAIKYLELTRDPKFQDIDYFSALGQSYFRTGNFAKAAEVLSLLQAKKPPQAVAEVILKQLGEAYEKTGKEAKAAEAYNAYISLKGVRDPDVSYLCAYLREKTDRTEAIRLYASNTKFYPKDARNFVRLGLLYSQDKAALTQAAQALSVATELVDSQPQVWLTAAQVYGKLGNENQELAAYKKVLSFDNQNIEANRRVGAILIKKGQYVPAIASLEATLTMAPKDAEVMLLLADAYLKTKRPEQAADLLSKASAINKDDPALKERLYGLYKELGKKDKAEAEIKALVELKKDNRHRTAYARDLLADKRYSEAQVLAKDITASDPANIEGLMILAETQRGMGKAAEAIESYKAIGFVNSDYAPALAARADTYVEMNQPGRAKEYYLKAEKLDPKNAQIQVGLAKVAKAENDQAEYQKRLGKAKSLDPQIKTGDAPAPAPAGKDAKKSQ